MKSKGATFAFVAGLTAGIFNLLIGLNALLGALIMQSYAGVADTMTVALVLMVITGVNFAGGCVCRVNRIVGGVMMLVTALPMLIAGAILICVPLLPPELLAGALGAAFTSSFTRALLAIGILLLLIELASGAAGVVSLAMRKQPEYATESLHRSGEEDTAVLSFAQKYAARLQQDSSIPTDENM